MLNTRQLSEDEKIIKIVRQHPIVLRHKILISLILITGPFFFLTLLLRFDNIGLVIFFSILIFGILYLIKFLIAWRSTIFYITNKKIIDTDYKKIFDKTTTQVPLEQILDSSFKLKGVLQNIFNFGELKINFAQGTSKIILQNISKPKKVQNILQTAIDNFKIIDNKNQPLTD